MPAALRHPFLINSTWTISFRNSINGRNKIKNHSDSSCRTSVNYYQRDLSVDMVEHKKKPKKINKTAADLNHLSSPSNHAPSQPGKLSFSKNRSLSVWIPLAVFVWPFLYLAEYILSFHGKYTAMGNDFYPFYYKYKIYLLAHLAHGHLPLWSPSEAAGYPLFSSPLAQFFYPFNLLLVLWYKLAGGYSSIDYQRFTIFGLSIFGLGLYYWLKLINGNLRAVLFSVLIMTVSFRLTESLRFPNGIHTAAWYPWILYAFTRIFLSPSIKKSIIPCLILIFSTICMITAGYSYFVYYSIFLFVPYILMLSFKSTRTITVGQSNIQWKVILPGLWLSGSIVSLLCLPYLISVMRLMKMTYNRSGGSFYYSTSYTFTAQDSLGALIYPPLSQMEGWYYFSLTGVLLIGLFFIWIFLSPSKLPCLTLNINYSVPPLYRRRLCLLLLVWIALISYLSYGKDSYLFKLLWQIMPGFSNLRVWGRLNIILIPLFAWLLSIAYDAFEKITENRWANADSISKKSKFSLILIFTGLYLIILQIQLFLYLNKIEDPYWKNNSGPMVNMRILFLILGGAGFLAILFFLICGKWVAVRVKHFQFLIFGILCFIAAVEMWPVGAHIWSSRTPFSQERPHLNPATFHQEAFARTRVNIEDTLSLKPVYNVGRGSLNWYFDHYIRFLLMTEREKQNRDILLGVKGGQHIFLSESLQHNSIYSFLKDSLRFPDTGKMISYTGDELVWEVVMPNNGYFSFIDNWDPYWKAYVDDKETPLERLFGTFKSVPLTQGKHRVVFRYEPTLKAVIFGTK
jgi:hypothetical protein